MKNATANPKNQADLTVKDEDILTTTSCNTVKESKTATPDGVVLTVLMAMTMNIKDIHKMCTKYWPESDKPNMDPGYELWGLYHATQDPQKSELLIMPQA